MAIYGPGIALLIILVAPGAAVGQDVRSILSAHPQDRRSAATLQERGSGSAFFVETGGGILGSLAGVSARASPLVGT
jgi:hypothetical protein